MALERMTRELVQWLAGKKFIEMWNEMFGGGDCNIDCGTFQNTDAFIDCGGF
jgi:hypothetical protein